VLPEWALQVYMLVLGLVALLVPVPELVPVRLELVLLLSQAHLSQRLEAEPLSKALRRSSVRLLLTRLPAGREVRLQALLLMQAAAERPKVRALQVYMLVLGLVALLVPVPVRLGFR
jgi:hypothetical protein